MKGKKFKSQELSNGCIDTWLEPSEEFYEILIISVCLIILGGIMSGLQQGIFQLSEIEIISQKNEIKTQLKKYNKIENSDLESKPLLKQRENRAKTIEISYFNVIKLKTKLFLFTILEGLIKNTHLTLVTLLVGNALAMEALPIYMDMLMPKQYAVLFSVTFLVIFGEILPQALCLRFPLFLTLCFTIPVQFLIICLSPVCYPISLLLDYIFGVKKYNFLSRFGLKDLILKHSKELNGPLETDESDIIMSALSFKSYKVKDIYRKLSDLYSLDYEQVVDDNLLRDILRVGYSRIPVFKNQKSNIIGILLTKNLIRFGSQKINNSVKKIKDLQIYPCFKVNLNTNLFELLTKFRSGKCHMAIVMNKIIRKSSISSTKLSEIEENDVLGIVTLEDVLEKLLKRDINDEKDTWLNTNTSIENNMKEVKKLKFNLENILKSHISKSEIKIDFYVKQSETEQKTRTSSESYGSLSSV